MSDDALSGALAALEISASALLHAAYRAPWSIAVPTSEEIGRVLGAAPGERLAAFHWAEQGAFRLVTDDAVLEVGCGEMVVCFGGVAHRLEAGAAGLSVGLEELLAGAASLSAGDPAAGDAQLICGVFRLRDAQLNPLVSSLPTILHARTVDPAVEPLATLLRSELDGGRGSSFIVGRALEILCAGIIRQHLAAGPSGPGFLRTLTDTRLGAALEAIHDDPAAPWTLDSLAREAGLSRSRFSALFTAQAGEPPMSYLARWRMGVALRLLRGSDRSVSEVATAVGYESVPAFSRAFKRLVGDSPGRFRHS